MKLGWRTVFPLFLVILVVITIMVFHQTKLFTVRTITCQTDVGECPDYVQAELNSHLGKSLFFSDFYDVGEQITRLTPFLARFELRKEFPDTIHITFFSAEPRYRYAEPSGQLWVVDDAGYVIRLANPDDTFPVVYASEGIQFLPNTREKIESTLHDELLTAFSTLEAQGLLEAQFILLSPSEAALQLPNGKTAYFMLEEAPQQLAKLSYLLKHFDFSTFKETIPEIDLRFSQVILRNYSSSASAAAVISR